MNIRKKFGKNVRTKRQQLGLSQEALAFDAKSNRTYISDVERGTRNPSIEVVQRIAKALGVTMGELLDGTLESNTCCERSERTPLG